MIDSLRDQLLKLGFPEPAREPPKLAPAPQRSQHRLQHDPSTRNQPVPVRHDRERQRREQPRGSARAATAPQPARQARPAHPHTARTQAEIDLGKAYALRAQQEKNERIQAERQKQEAARIKREAKARVAELLKDNTLNDAAAELVRHFDYSGKIKRIHVNADQLKALNAGELGVVQLDGRYLLVSAEHARQTQVLLPSLLALLVDPDAPAADDPYADPAYRVPDDLVW